MNTTATRQYTHDDLLHLPDDGNCYELIHGELVKKNMSWMPCTVGGKMFLQLGNNVEKQDTGTVFPQDSSYLLMVDGDVCVRKPDVSLIRKEHYTAEDEQADGHISIVPDLLAELVSTGELIIDTDRKVEAYLKAGVQLVWIVRPEQRMVEVNRQWHRNQFTCRGHVERRSRAPRV